MELKLGIYANCSEWNEEVSSDYDRDNDLSPRDEEFFSLKETAEAMAREKDWD